MRLANAVALFALTSLLWAGCNKAGGNANGASGAAAGANANAAPVDAKASLRHLGNNLHAHEEAGIQFEVPRGWKLSPMGDQFVMIAPDDSVSVVFTITEMTSLQQVEEEIDQELGEIMAKVKADGEPREHNLNGMQAFSQEGSGEIEGKGVIWVSVLIVAKKPVLIYAFADPVRARQREPEVDRFIGSIKRVG